MGTVAYDYDAQRWVEGPYAEKLLARQDAEETELMRDPEYRAFIEKRCSECGGGHSNEACPELNDIECEACAELVGKGRRCCECQMNDFEDGWDL